MVTVKKNIWLLFGFILAISSLLFLSYLSNLWERNLGQYHKAQHSQLELFANDVESFLKSQESLLEVLGNQLALDSVLPESAIHSSVLDRVRATHPTMAGLGLADLNGNLLVVSSNLQLSRLPNLLDKEVSRDTFLATIESKKLTLGRTYQLSFVDDTSMAIAIRKAITKDNGESVAVMTAGLDVSQGPFDVKLEDFQQIDIVRSDGFYQFSSAFRQVPNIYDEQASSELRSLLRELIEDGKPASQGNALYSLESTLTGVEYLFAASYNPYFDYWVVSRIEKSYIEQAFYQDAVILLLFFLTGFLIIFALAKSISVNEKEKFDELLYQACHDELTGLPNQRYLKQTFTQPVASDLYVIGVNIDRLKGINDTYGHSFGDQILIDFAARLASFREDGTVLARGVGDEFYFLFSSTDDVQVELFCNQLHEVISKPYQRQDLNVLITASIAVASPKVCGTDPESLMRGLDIAMIQAKKSRNTTCFISAQLQEQHTHALTLEHRLKRALKTRSISVVYQPQVDSHGQLYGLEALARWTDSELGFVPPDKFIYAAEQSGLMPELGKQIIEKAMQETALFQRQSLHGVSLSINISVIQLMQADFIDHLFTQIEKYSVDPLSLILEFTESVFIEDLVAIEMKCRELVAMGIRVSLDDFGTGYSSLGLLNKLPFRELKIDKSFIDEICHDERSRLMLKNIIDIASNYQMSVVAEGIESHEQKQILDEFGCSQFQGYLFSKPIMIGEVIERNIG